MSKKCKQTVPNTAAKQRIRHTIRDVMPYGPDGFAVICNACVEKYVEEIYGYMAALHLRFSERNIKETIAARIDWNKFRH